MEKSIAHHRHHPSWTDFQNNQCYYWGSSDLYSEEMM